MIEKVPNAYDTLLFCSAFDNNIFLLYLRKHDIFELGNQSEAAYLLRRVNYNPPIQKKGGLPMVTYADLIQIGIFIVALIGLCYQIFKSKK